MGRKGSHEFGGDWTEQKLDILARYLDAYVFALKNKSYSTWYIDAFAGTGYRTPRQSTGQEEGLFADLLDPASERLLHGSAVRALETDPPFAEYLFIERDPRRVKELEGLRQQYPARAGAISVVQGEANDCIKRLCKESWSDRRAVLFLDPYGMQVEWDTIVAVAETRAIDLWVLFPLGVAANRLLPSSGIVPDGWRSALNRLLGSEEWFDRAYAQETTEDLFGHVETRLVKQPADVIGEFFVERLRSAFAGVATKPRVLTNSKNSPLYLLCFAVGNPWAVKPALRIANHILRKF
ncbi:MAG: three-Cys-motif partner protein TcmP [Candidatus Eisenbacteria bacterium]